MQNKQHCRELGKKHHESSSRNVELDTARKMLVPGRSLCILGFRLIKLRLDKYDQEKLLLHFLGYPVADYRVLSD